MVLLAVMGPTASGKTPLAESLASDLDAQLINADAFQVYRGLDIGTAKPERKELYSLLDIKEPIESFGVGEYVVRAAELLRTLFEAGRSAVVVGGTGLYIRALFENYVEMRPTPDPELRLELERTLAEKGLEELASRLRSVAPREAERVDPRNPVRVRRALERVLDPRSSLRIEIPNFRKVKLGLFPKKETLEMRIDERMRQMVQNGWVEEVRRLWEKGIPREAPGLRAIGYRAIYDYLAGVSSREAAEEGIRLKTRQYAKRQRTWLRSEPFLEALEGDLTTEHAFEAAMRVVASHT